MSSNNIFTFPPPKNKPPEKDAKTLADDVVDDIIENTLTELHENGFNVLEDKFIDDFTFNVEILKAALYRKLDIDHPFHTMIDYMIDKLNAGDFKNDN